MKFLFTFTFLIIFSDFYSQILTIGNTTNPYICDGWARITDTLLYTEVEHWYNESGFVQNGGFTADSLCPGNYQIYFIDSSGLAHSSTFTIVNGFEYPCMSISSSVITVPATDTTTCDGSATISVIGGEPPYQFNWIKFQNLDNWGYNNFENLHIYSPSVSNLCAGKYFVEITDNIGCSESIFFNILGDSTSESCNGLYVRTKEFESSSYGSCNGSVKAIMGGGNNPYYGLGLLLPSVVDGRAYNICSPYYAISSAIDLLNCTVSYSILIGPFLSSIGDTIIFNNSPYDDSSVVASVASAWINNCLFNFNNLADARIISFTPIGDSTIVRWELELINGVTFSLDVLYDFNAGDGIYNVVLQLVCTQKNEPKFLKVTSSLDYQSIGICETNFSNIRLFPNPVQNELIINGLDGVAKFSIIDILGRVVLNGELPSSNQINVTSLNQGQYFLSIEKENMPFSLKFNK